MWNPKVHRTWIDDLLLHTVWIPISWFHFLILLLLARTLQRDKTWRRRVSNRWQCLPPNVIDSWTNRIYHGLFPLTARNSPVFVTFSWETGLLWHISPSKCGRMTQPRGRAWLPAVLCHLQLRQVSFSGGRTLSLLPSGGVLAAPAPGSDPALVAAVEEMHHKPPPPPTTTLLPSPPGYTGDPCRWSGASCERERGGGGGRRVARAAKRASC